MKHQGLKTPVAMEEVKGMSSAAKSPFRSPNLSSPAPDATNHEDIHLRESDPLGASMASSAYIGADESIDTKMLD